MRTYGTMAFALIAGCSSEVTGQPEAPPNNEAAKKPIMSIEPDLIGREIIEQYDLSDAGCSAPVEGREGYLFLARMEDAHFLLDGALVSLVPNSDAETLPYGVSSHYEGLTHSVEIAIDLDSQAALGPETLEYNGSWIVRDLTGQIVFTHSGTIHCGA